MANLVIVNTSGDKVAFQFTGCFVLNLLPRFFPEVAQDEQFQSVVDEAVHGRRVRIITRSEGALEITRTPSAVGECERLRAVEECERLRAV